LYNVYDDISRLVILAYPGEQSVHRDDLGVKAFIESLDDYNLELYVRSQNPKDLDAALNMHLLWNHSLPPGENELRLNNQMLVKYPRDHQ